MCQVFDDGRNLRYAHVRPPVNTMTAEAGARNPTNWRQPCSPLLVNVAEYSVTPPSSGISQVYASCSSHARVIRSVSGDGASMARSSVSCNARTGRTPGRTVLRDWVSTSGRTRPLSIWVRNNQVSNPVRATPPNAGMRKSIIAAVAVRTRWLPSASSPEPCVWLAGRWIQMTVESDRQLADHASPCQYAVPICLASSVPGISEGLQEKGRGSCSGSDVNWIAIIWPALLTPPTVNCERKGKIRPTLAAPSLSSRANGLNRKMPARPSSPSPSRAIHRSSEGSETRKSPPPIAVCAELTTPIGV